MAFMRAVSGAAAVSLAASGAVPLQLAGTLERPPPITETLASVRASYGFAMHDPSDEAFRRLPRQADGGQAKVVQDTRAAGGAGRKPGKGLGALPPAFSRLPSEQRCLMVASDPFLLVTENALPDFVVVIAPAADGPFRTEVETFERA